MYNAIRLLCNNIIIFIHFIHFPICFLVICATIVLYLMQKSTNSTFRLNVTKRQDKNSLTVKSIHFYLKIKLISINTAIIVIQNQIISGFLIKYILKYSNVVYSDEFQNWNFSFMINIRDGQVRDFSTQVKSSHSHPKSSHKPFKKFSSRVWLDLTCPPL